MINNIILGLVLGILALFGLRGVLPDIFAGAQWPVLIALAVAGSAGYIIGRFASRHDETHSHQ